jgi:hypothetical protein
MEATMRIDLAAFEAGVVLAGTAEELRELGESLIEAADTEKNVEGHLLTSDGVESVLIVPGWTEPSE